MMKRILPNPSLSIQIHNHNTSFKEALKFKPEVVYILKSKISTTLPFNLVNHFFTSPENLEDNSSGPQHFI